jgi:2,3-bisphosphoglycerate-independent phosphoglycerate mutase
MKLCHNIQLKTAMKIKQKVLLLILDGLGAAPDSPGNAVVKANPRNLATLWNTSAHTYLLASSEAVGLPKDVKGNSEVGHMNIGAGRVIMQTLPRIDNSITTEKYYKNAVLHESLQFANRNKSNIHLLTLISDGGVHAHINHLIATLKFYAHSNYDGNIFIHAFTDGRDSPPNSAKKYLDKVQEAINKYGQGTIATVCGRSWAMDRNSNWQRTKLAYDLITQNIGTSCSSYSQCLINNYTNGFSDEFVEPSVIVDNSNIKQNDVVLFLNFRPDRALQLTRALIDDNFTFFSRVNIYPTYFASMVESRKSFPPKVLFPKQYINMPIGNILASAGLKQLRIAESEKFPHVTYFFNGGMAVRYSNEDRIEIPSQAVSTYEEKPEMSALQLTDMLMNRIENNVYDFIVANFANPDMVGHTGNLEATTKAVSVVDNCIGELVKAFTLRGGAVVITSDHGNAEEVINLDTGEMDTEHSINPVPLIINGSNIPPRNLPYGALKDITPTILDIMGIPRPIEMTGVSLLRSNEERF